MTRENPAKRLKKGKDNPSSFDRERAKRASEKAHEKLRTKRERIAAGCPAESQMLLDMRKVLKQRRECDDAGEASIRKYLDEKPDVFMAQVERMQREYEEGVKAWHVAQGEKGREAELDADPRYEELEELIEGLLKEWESS